MNEITAHHSFLLSTTEGRYFPFDGRAGLSLGAGPSLLSDGCPRTERRRQRRSPTQSLSTTDGICGIEMASGLRVGHKHRADRASGTCKGGPTLKHRGDQPRALVAPVVQTPICGVRTWE